MKRFKTILIMYASRHNRNGKWPRWYREPREQDDDYTGTYPDEQPHPSTNEHDENWDEDISSMGPIGLLIESILWN